MHIIYLALGTNLGDRLANLHAAINLLSQSSIVHRQSSHVYETPPWGYTDQPAFLNMAVKCETDLDAASLLKRLKQIEVQVGRVESFHWGPRLIDIDILFYDNLVMDTPQLVIPHPRLHERAFVLIPLADIAPDLVHPVLDKTIRELLQAVDRSGIQRASDK